VRSIYPFPLSFPNINVSHGQMTKTNKSEQLLFGFHKLSHLFLIQNPTQDLIFNLIGFFLSFLRIGQFFSLLLLYHDINF
jgi:hypothetical protein